MAPENLSMRILFFSQTAVGILGNWTILLSYVMCVFTGKSLMPKDQILKHLVLANSVVIISRIIPYILVELGLQYLVNDLSCKLTLYSNRVSRGISLHCTCILSCFQAITINPNNSRWMKFKHSVSNCLVLSCSLSWPMHMLLNSRITLNVIGPYNNSNFTKKIMLGFCSTFVIGNTVFRYLQLFLLCFTDSFCLCLMIWASFFMMSILYRHKSQLQHIHSAQHSLRTPPEDRAIKTILILVCTFVLSYSMSFILVIYNTVSNNLKRWIINILTFLDTCFPTFCPIILISNNNSFHKNCFPCYRRK